MKLYKRKYQAVLAGVLCVVLATGCTPRPDGSASAGTKTADTTTQSQPVKLSQEEILALQKNFDSFTDEVFRKQVIKSTIDLHYTLADPTAYGITDYPVQLGEFSLDYLKVDLQDTKDIYSRLKDFKPELLTKEQKLTYDVFRDYLETGLMGEGFELYAQPLSPTIGVQAQLPVILAEYAFYRKQDVEDYLELVSQLDDYYGQIIEFEKEKSAAGLFMSDVSVDHIIESCQGYLLTPEHNFMAETFENRLDALPDLTAEEKADYIARNLKVVEENFIPAYQLLVDGLTQLKGSGKDDMGLSHFPDGAKYYEYLLRSSTGTSYATVDDLLKAAEKQLDSDLIAITKILQQNPEVGDKLYDYSFTLTDPNTILEDLQVQIKKDFPKLPASSYTVKYVPEALESALSPAFYLTPPLDLYENNVIYINGGQHNADTDLYTMLAHEGYPGHLYQNVYFNSTNTCDLRQLLSYSSYSEGWASYVEDYSYTLDNGLDPNLGKLLAHNSAASMALHSILDININYNGWTKDQVREYLSQYYNVEGTSLVDDMYSTLIECPTNYLKYYVGYLEIIHMRDTAKATLKEQFDLNSFHTFLLDIGPASFDVIQSYFKVWLLTAKL